MKTNFNISISKTTLFGYMFLALAGLDAVKFDAAGHFDMTPQGWFKLGVGIIGTIVGHTMQDAGKTEAKTPSGDVELVDSHETPFDPNNKPVKP